jgi:hypothetical protein
MSASRRYKTAVEFNISISRQNVCFLNAKLYSALAFIQYTAAVGAGAGLVVSIELLALGDEAVPNFKYEPVMFGQVFVAPLADLWRMKARAYVADRAGERMHDLGDYEWLECQMVEKAVEYNAVDLTGIDIRRIQGTWYLVPTCFRVNFGIPRQTFDRVTALHQNMHNRTLTARIPPIFDILSNQDVVVRW